MFETWIAEGVPSSFWLPGFYFPQSFLTSILQNHARKNYMQVDTLKFGFEFTDKSRKQLSELK